MTYWIPKKTNSIIFQSVQGAKDGVTDDMDWKEEEKIINNNNYQYTKKKYESIGIKIIDELSDSELVEVELPEGWRIEPKNAIWFVVFDIDDKEVFSFFSKIDCFSKSAFTNF